MANIIKYPFPKNINVLGTRRIAYGKKDASLIIDSQLFPPASAPTSIYIGPSTRSVRYLGNRTDSAMYLGTGILFP